MPTISYGYICKKCTNPCVLILPTESHNNRPPETCPYGRGKSWLTSKFTRLPQDMLIINPDYKPEEITPTPPTIQRTTTGRWPVGD